MGELIGKLAGIFSGGAGAAVGTVATVAGILAALSPLAIFLVSSKGNEVFVSVTYREAAFWGTMIAVNLYVAYLTRRNAS